MAAHAHAENEHERNLKEQMRHRQEEFKHSLLNLKINNGSQAGYFTCPISRSTLEPYY